MNSAMVWKLIEGNSTLKFDVDGLKAGDTREFVARVYATRAGAFSSRADSSESGDVRLKAELTSNSLTSKVTSEEPTRLFSRQASN